MDSKARSLMVLLVTALVACAPVATPAYADAASALRCQRTISKELGKFIKLKSQTLQKCKGAAVKRGDPASPVDCPLTAQDDKINAAAQKMKDKIAASCGGANRVCNVADSGADADEPLAGIGWDIGVCPDLRGQGCTNAINDCNDIGTCVACIGHEGVNQATELYFDLMSAGEFASGSAVNDCQVMIGKVTVKFLQAKARLLQKCWDKVMLAKDGFTSPPGCPNTDARTVSKIMQAKERMILEICDHCGAGGDANRDGLCDQPGTAISPGAIGFEPDCPDRTVPGDLTPCVRPVASLQDLIACVACVTDFELACVTDLAVPQQATYSPLCNATP